MTTHYEVREYHSSEDLAEGCCFRRQFPTEEAARRYWPAIGGWFVVRLVRVEETVLQEVGP